MTQYAVVYRKDFTQHVDSAVGPFRSFDKALDAKRAIEDLEDEIDGDLGISPEIVACVTLREALDEIREILS